MSGEWGFHQKELEMRKTWIVFGVMLSLAIAAPMAVSQADYEIDASVAARAAAELADAHLGGLLDMMGILASTADLQVGVWGGMKDLLGRFEQLPVSFNAWYLLPDGSYYKVATDLASANLSDRAYFPKVMAGETTYGDLVVSKSTGRKSMVMTAPIVRSGEVIGALGATVYLDDFSTLILDALDLPAGLTLFAYTADGLIAFHPNAEVLLEDVESAGVDLDATVSATAEFLGWVFAVGPAAEQRRF